MAQLEEQKAEPLAGVGQLCLCEGFARVTESAALASARWLGRADQAAAHEAATSAMQNALEQMPIEGSIVLGAAEDSGVLTAGER
ncbi:MAG: fructose-bisphosphatase class II, partial [Gaiellaceae bacterium]